MINLAGGFHAAALALIHAAAFPVNARWSADAMALQVALPGAFGLLDERGGMLLARVAADEAEILTLAVRPELRRTGVGRALLAAAGAYAAERGAVAMFLEVAEHNHAARALYAMSEYAAIGRRDRYYTDGSAAITMRRTLARTGGADKVSGPCPVSAK